MCWRKVKQRGGERRCGEFRAEILHRKSTVAWEPCFGSVVVAGGGGAQGMSTELRCSPMPVPQGNMMHQPSPISLSVHMAHDLMWSEEKREWRWHKTWRLPEITTVVAAPGTVGSESLRVRLLLVSPGITSHQLEALPILSVEGEQTSVDGSIGLEQAVENGKAVFSKLRLTSTSNANHGRRFHLLVVVMRPPTEREVLNNAQREFVVGASMISSAFVVFSRRDSDSRVRRRVGSRDATSTAQKSHAPAGVSKVVAVDPAFQTFKPSFFAKEFVKKTSERCRDGTLETVEESINNSLEGLLRYFQAPNIRFKSRHPLLLASRFSRVLLFRYDSSRASRKLDPNRTEQEYLLRSLFCATGFTEKTCTLEHCESCEIRHEPLSEQSSRSAVWCLALRSEPAIPDRTRAWLHQHFECSKTMTLGFVENENVLPSRYEPFDDLRGLEELYTLIYNEQLESFPTAERKVAESGGGGGKGMKRSIGVRAQAGERGEFESPWKLRQEYGSAAGGALPLVRDTASYCGPGRSANYLQWGAHKRRLMQHRRTLALTAEHGRTAVPLEGVNFTSYFLREHKRVRTLLMKVVDAASRAVASFTTREHVLVVEAYERFSEDVAIHAFVEDTVLFPALEARKAGVTEPYAYDHFKEGERMARIREAVSNTTADTSAELFLQISSFAALHTEHMDKEEEHLLPYFESLFRKGELDALVSACDGLSREAKKLRLPSAPHEG